MKACSSRLRVAVRALRFDGQLPVRGTVRAGEQHLHADRTDYDYRAVCQDSHSADRICRQAAVGRHDPRAGGIQCGKGSPAPILMTVLSMVFGLVPLMMAHGVGANGSRFRLPRA